MHGSRDEFGHLDKFLPLQIVEIQFESPATEEQIVALMKEINYAPDGLLSL